VSPTDDLRWTDVMEFLEEYRHESPATRQALLAQTPEESAEPKWDVFLGALAEHLAIGDTQPVPAWACSDQYSWCGRAWFVSDLPTAGLGPCTFARSVPRSWHFSPSRRPRPGIVSTPMEPSDGYLSKT
jgi:hypothetical protein